MQCLDTRFFGSSRSTVTELIIKSVLTAITVYAVFALFIYASISKANILISMRTGLRPNFYWFCARNVRYVAVVAVVAVVVIVAIHTISVHFHQSCYETRNLKSLCIFFRSIGQRHRNWSICLFGCLGPIGSQTGRLSSPVMLSLLTRPLPPTASDCLW